MKKYKFICGLSIILISLDQIIKLLISNFFNLHDSVKIIPNFLYITYVKNYGAAWSMFSGQRLFLIIISVVGAIFVLYLIKQEKKLDTFKNIYYSFLLGGIVGNFIDRLFLGSVIDYIDTYIFGYNFPVFNLADSLIVCGVILMIIESVVKNYGKSNSK